MEDISVFVNKEEQPNNEQLKDAIGDSFENWLVLRNFVFGNYPNAIEEWNFSGKKYGWSFRVKDKKRVLIYLLPRKESFKAAFVFGQKAYD